VARVNRVLLPRENAKQSLDDERMKLKAGLLPNRARK